MKSENKLSKLRKETNSLMRERYRLEKRTLESRAPMVAAAFCYRANGSCYLSTSIDGESRHRYVSQAEEYYWKSRAETWKIYSQAIARWVKLTQEIEINLREIGRLRCTPLPQKKLRGKHESS